MTITTTSNASRMPDNVESRPASDTTTPTEEYVWTGIGCRLGDQHLVVSLAEMREVFNYSKHPKPSPVPASSPWLKGVVSLRGQLLSIIDLDGFMLGEFAAVTPRSRVLVIKHPHAYAGLLVDEIMGIKRFKASEKATKGPRFAGRIPRFLNGVFRQDDDYWGILSVAKLAQDAAFIDIAG